MTVFRTERLAKPGAAILNAAFTPSDGPPVDPNAVAVTCLVHDAPIRPNGPSRRGGLARPASFAHRGQIALYPASVVKLFFLAAFARLADAGLLIETDEDRKALSAMIRRSDNDATGHVVDRLTGTAGGPNLPPDAFAHYAARRRSIDRFFAAWGWPEFRDIAVHQKTYDEGPYGREAAFRRLAGANSLTTDATARLLYALVGGGLVASARTAMLLDFLDRGWERTPEALADPENQVTGFLIEGMPETAQVWSKAGWTSTTRHDALYAELPDGRALTLVAFTTSPSMAEHTRFLPRLARLVVAAVEDGRLRADAEDEMAQMGIE